MSKLYERLHNVKANQCKLLSNQAKKQRAMRNAHKNELAWAKRKGEQHRHPDEDNCIIAKNTQRKTYAHMQ